ncbi:MAG: 3,4-dihydroxy-2-butanone-4-phosphate synthase [Candidatus Thermoplasmatota archaeon]|jgi:3,4-dihydroxy 2-butanone 4-phosphate synthase|nr:3,4-dihydroxy-2-butanone 4-phosphate synthase [Methanomassiliicoccales archaeon RumEn M2]MDI9378857.1 3,4-dihydroxy-2-butanone-4-phosphate synthase [Candidatus Thermoplasmatota archaeon]
MRLEHVLDEIRKGRMVLVFDFDDRERETDMTIASEFIRKEDIRRMRKDAGGLVCTTTPYAKAKAVGLPFMADIYADDSSKYPLMLAMAPTDIPYDGTKSSFGVTINHRKTYTGITDADRALTIGEYARTIFQDKSDDQIAEELGKNFRAPGHVHLLNTSQDILMNRRGHTELCTALMIMAGVKPSATICEMLGDDGGSETKENAMAYADREGLAFITGDEVISAWEEFKKKKR